MSDSNKNEPINKKRCLDRDLLEASTSNIRSVGYNRCRKPFPKSTKCSKSNLRKISENHVTIANQKYSIVPQLNLNDRVCNACRKLLVEACESSQENESEAKSTSSELSQNVLSDIAEFVSDEIHSVEVPAYKLQQFKDLLENMKIKFNHVNTTMQEKLQILTLLPKNWTYVEIQTHFEASNYMLNLARKLQNEKGPMSTTSIRKGTYFEKSKNIILDFYKSEDNCYILPGIKDAVKSRDTDGNVISEQKRLILCTLKELYLSFKTIYPNINIGFSSFARFRPKCCLLAGSSGTHSVCVCSIHQNVKLLILGCSLENLTKNYDVKFKTYKDLLNYIVCPKHIINQSPECYLGKCKDCPGIEKLKDYLNTIFYETNIDEVNYSQWISVPITTLKNLIDDTDTFITYFCEKIEILLPHAFIANQQTNYYKTLKRQITYKELVVNVDFAENYSFVVQDAPPGFHWNNNQATVFVAFVYYKTIDSDELKSKGFVVISDNLMHDTVAVYTYQQLLIDYIKMNYPNIEQLHYFSDGAPQQFKNYKNIINLCHHKNDFGLQADWNFFPTAHGKGACDGVGGSVKRTAAKASLRLPVDKQILTALTLYNWLKNQGNFENVDFSFSAVANYNKNKNKLNKRFKNMNRIKNLQSHHHLMPLPNGKVLHKIYSTSPEGTETRII